MFRTGLGTGNTLSKSQSPDDKTPFMAAKRILVVGGGGYLGSVLVRELLSRGFSVRVLDAFLFDSGSLDEFRLHPNLEVVRGDIRDLRLAATCMSGCDAVIHLAAVVGDSACEDHRALAIDVNRDGTRLLARTARDCGLSRFVFASSCSVYGASQELLDEDSVVNPLSLYAQTKSDAERILFSCKTEEFCPTVLRLGTLFGLSPRMRFDLVVNLFVAQAASRGRITIWNEDQWRPFLHVQDAARAFIACLDAPSDAVSREIFNVGSPSLNLQLSTLGQEIVRLIPGTRVDTVETEDRRDYRVAFGKIRRLLGFRCGRSLAFGIGEMQNAIRSGAVADFTAEQFNNQSAMRKLPRLPNPSVLRFKRDSMIPVRERLA